MVSFKAFRALTQASPGPFSEADKDPWEAISDGAKRAHNAAEDSPFTQGMS